MYFFIVSFLFRKETVFLYQVNNVTMLISHQIFLRIHDIPLIEMFLVPLGNELWF